MTDILKYLDEDGVTWKPFTTAVGDAASIGGATLPAILDAIFPVGSVYVSGSDTMPALIASIGTWARLDGRVIVGVDASQTEFNTVNKTGGSKTHNHGLWSNGYARIFGEGNYVYDARVDMGYSAPSNHRQTVSAAANVTYHSSLATRLGGATDYESTLPPFKAKYMWERIS